MYQIVWQGIVHDSQGYARASREYLLALDRLGLDIKVEPLNFGTKSTVLLSHQAERIRELINKPTATDKKKILIYHAQPYGVDANYEREHNGYEKVIINTVWETTKVPEQWFPRINMADAVVVPSKQNKKALEDSGVTVPIYLVPHGADIKTFNPDNDPMVVGESEDTFKFLSVFQWQHRKAPEILLKAYWEEFGSEDNVSLVIKTYWSNKPSETRQIKDTVSSLKQQLGHKNTAPILLTGSKFDDIDMQGLYTMADVFVLPSRGEGVGLPYLESMSSGVPCIATGWGGQVDFINRSNGYLVDYTLKGTSDESSGAISKHFFNAFTNDMKWAEPSIESLRKQMRYAYENQKETRQKGTTARKDMKGMTWDDSGVTFKNSIEKVIL